MIDELEELQRFVDKPDTEGKLTTVNKFLRLVLTRRLVNEDDAAHLKFHVVEDPADPDNIQGVAENLFTYLVMQNVPVTYEIARKAPRFAEPAPDIDVDVNGDAQA